MVEERLQKFLSSTFYKNRPALEAHFAAIGLVMRGLNVDRAFWTMGSGGVGQSLWSHLLASTFKDSHAFLDMPIYLRVAQTVRAHRWQVGGDRAG